MARIEQYDSIYRRTLGTVYESRECRFLSELACVTILVHRYRNASKTRDTCEDNTYSSQRISIWLTMKLRVQLHKTLNVC